MDKDENFLGESIIKLDFIKKIENRINLLQDGKCSNVINDMKSFMTCQKNECKNLIENTEVSKCNSLLSIGDIKMEVYNENIISNRRRSNSLKDYFTKLEKVNSICLNDKPKDMCKNAGTNTESISKCDVIIQTNKPKNNSRDYIQDLFYLRGQTNDFNDIIAIYQMKCNRVLESISLVSEKLKTLIEHYNPSLDSRLKYFLNAETETSANVLDKWVFRLEKCNKLPSIRNQLDSLMIKETELEKKSIWLIKEIEEQFIIMEEMTKKNEELSLRFDSLLADMTDTKEMDEFRRTENAALRSSFERFQEDFHGYMLCQKKMVFDIQDEFRSERNKSNSENRELLHKIENLERDLIMGCGDEKYVSKDAGSMRQSVVDYPLLGSDRDNEIITLRKKLTLLEDDSLCLTQEKERWKSEKAHLSAMAADEDHCLKLNISMIEVVNDKLEEDLRRASEQRDAYRFCINDLKQACLSECRRYSDNGVDGLRKILAKYSF